MALAYYPGYDIERFEDQNGRLCIRLVPVSSLENLEAGDARKEKIQEHQKREAIRKAEE